MHSSIDAIHEFLQDLSNTTEIDPSIISREGIERISDSSRVVRIRYQLPALISNREFIIHEYPLHESWISFIIIERGNI